MQAKHTKTPGAKRQHRRAQRILDPEMIFSIAKNRRYM